MALVVGKTNRADGVALRARVLPFPSAIRGLREDGCKGDERRKTARDQKISCGLTAQCEEAMPPVHRPEKAWPAIKN